MMRIFGGPNSEQTQAKVLGARWISEKAAMWYDQGNAEEFRDSGISAVIAKTTQQGSRRRAYWEKPILEKLQGVVLDRCLSKKEATWLRQRSAEAVLSGFGRQCRLCACFQEKDGMVSIFGRTKP